MNIYDYFEEYNKKYYKMKDKLVEIKEAEFNFYNLSGSKFSDYPKTKNSTFGFNEQLIRIENLIEEYKKLEKDYLEERDKCVDDINKMKTARLKTIIKLSFLERKSNKTISNIFSKIYKLNYSIEYIKKLKSQAIKEFEQSNTFTLNDTK